MYVKVKQVNLIGFRNIWPPVYIYLNRMCYTRALAGEGVCQCVCQWGVQTRGTHRATQHFAHLYSQHIAAASQRRCAPSDDTKRPVFVYLYRAHADDDGVARRARHMPARRQFHRRLLIRRDSWSPALLFGGRQRASDRRQVGSVVVAFGCGVCFFAYAWWWWRWVSININSL